MGTNNGCVIRVLVRPNAPNSTIREITDEALGVDVKAPPEKDKANKELIRLLSRVFDVPRTDLSIASGMKSREKLVKINRPLEYLKQRLDLLETT
jgi:hypothetical protein